MVINTLKQFVCNSRRIVSVLLTILWGWHLGLTFVTSIWKTWPYLFPSINILLAISAVFQLIEDRLEILCISSYTVRMQENTDQ